ncbi:hypothetical protein [Actinoplanes sp. NPDC049802]|uniref:hypothetical protein n=1 Tax=Actinoplanes sp. NPDC049802 TaxID=3154742 RepID=UPI0033EDCA18
MGCLFALFAGVFPRLALFIIWLVRPRLVDAAFEGWIWPLLGLIFFPFATLIYVVLYTPGVGLVGWEWFWVIFAGLLDLTHLVASAYARSRQARGAGAPGAY